MFGHFYMKPARFLNDDQGDGGIQNQQAADDAPFSVGKEDWDRTQSELNELRGYKEKFGELESKHNEFQERFKPFLENQSDKNKNTDPEPRQNDPKYGGDASKYARDLVRWEARQEFNSQTALRESSQREQQEAATAKESEKQVFSKLTEADKRGAEKFKDYHAIISGSVLNIGQVPGLPQTLAKMENPEDIAYHYGTNPQEAYAFLNQVQSNPDAAMRTLILLDHRFSEAGKQAQAPAREYKPTQKPGGKPGAGESMSDRVKSAVWDEINGR